MSTNTAPVLEPCAVLAQDFVFPNEQTEYAQTRATLMAELNPRGILEQTFADEILGATWRLRRCRMDEANLAKLISGAGALNETIIERKQKWIEHSRAAAHLALRRSLAELRKLQTEREIRSRLEITNCPALADATQVERAAAKFQSRRPTMSDQENDGVRSFCKTPVAAHLPTAEERAATRRETLQTLELVRKARNRAA